MSRLPLAFAAALLASALVAASSCYQGLPPVTPCGEIPRDGCPVGNGGTCDDPTCPALYDCVDGKWTLTQVCPAYDGGSGAGGSSGSSGEAGVDLDSGAGDACTPVTIDLTGQTTDCTPDLMFPDCPVAAAEGCAETACTTGCADFYLCAAANSRPGCEDTGFPCWIAVAYCTDDGQLVVTTQ